MASINEIYSVGVGLGGLPAGAARDQYADCVERVILDRTGSLLLAFRMNVDTQRYRLAATYLEFARQAGVELVGPDFVKFVATRDDVEPGIRLAQIEALSGSRNPWAQEVLAQLYLQRDCPAYNGLCPIVAPNRVEAVRLLEDIAASDKSDSDAVRQGMRLVTLARLYLESAGPAYRFEDRACEKAREFALKGAQLGDACAMRELSDMFGHGRCQPVDSDAARMWERAQFSNRRPCPER